MKLFVTILFLLIAGCVSYKSSPLNYSVVDKVELTGIEVSFLNQSKHSVCLLPEMWPNPRNGLVVNAGKRVYLEVEGNKYFMENVDGDYCPGCSTEVAPGVTVKTFIPYELFDLPKNLYEKPKTIKYTIQPIISKCERGGKRV